MHWAILHTQPSELLLLTCGSPSAHTRKVGKASHDFSDVCKGLLPASFALSFIHSICIGGHYVSYTLLGCLDVDDVITVLHSSLQI